MPSEKAVAITANMAPETRIETIGKKRYVVAPVSMLVPGVLNGSKGPLFYPKEEVTKNADAWNGVPLTLGHPTTQRGKAASARSPAVLEKFSLGQVFNVSTKKGKLDGEAWFDEELTREKAPGILGSLANGVPIELSTGLFTNNHVQNGRYREKRYTHVARDYRPDHLAVLVDSRGACSLEDGCGVLVNEDNRRLYFFKGRNTGIVATSAEEARKKKKRGGDEIVAVRKLSASDRKTAARGDWIRTRKDGKSPEKSRFGKGRGYGPARNEECGECPLVTNCSLVANEIRKEGSKYVVYSKDGSKKLGTYDTMSEAEKRLGQVEMFKHMAKNAEEAKAAVTTLAKDAHKKRNGHDDDEHEEEKEKGPEGKKKGPPENVQKKKKESPPEGVGEKDKEDEGHHHMSENCEFARPCEFASPCEFAINANGCGAGSPGGKGFSKGNTCGSKTGAKFGGTGHAKSVGETISEDISKFEQANKNRDLTDDEEDEAFFQYTEKHGGNSDAEFETAQTAWDRMSNADKRKWLSGEGDVSRKASDAMHETRMNAKMFERARR